MVRQRLASVILASLLVVPPAAAQDEGRPPSDPDIEKVDDRPPDEPPDIRLEGEYRGVVPGKTQVDDKGRPVKRPKAGTLSWVGFMGEDGTAKIFLQAPNEFGFTQHVEGRTIVVHLEGLKRLGRQVRRPLYTQHFGTPVEKITVKKVGARKARKGKPARKAGIEVRIQLERAADAREAAARTQLEADGYFYLYLDVGASGPAATP
jgi:hypothetical protein